MGQTKLGRFSKPHANSMMHKRKRPACLALLRQKRLWAMLRGPKELRLLRGQTTRMRPQRRSPRKWSRKRRWPRIQEIRLAPKRRNTEAGSKRPFQKED